MSNDWLIIRGAREHNLKNVDLRLPREELVVFTGISGSGKSSLAFDTIYAEGQRRYVESLSSYARQFLGQMEKPDVDHIDGLSPAISIDQKSTTRNPRSTVGTITEIYDYLRLLYARIGVVYCPECEGRIQRQTPQQIIERILEKPVDSRLVLLSPLVKGRKGEYQQLLEETGRQGFSRVRVDGVIHDLDGEIKMAKNRKHDIEAVVDRLVIKTGVKRRLADSVETSLRLSGGTLVVLEEDGAETIFSENFSCPACGISFPEVEPRIFSFNSPFGACPTCSGLGYHQEIDPDLVVPDPLLSISEGAIAPWSGSGEYFKQQLGSLAEKYEFSLDTPFGELPEEVRENILYGAGKEKLYIRYRNRYGRLRSYFSHYEGVVNNLQRRYEETDSDYSRARISQYMNERPCPDCGGARLKRESLMVRVGEKNINQVAEMSVKEADAFFRNLKLDKRDTVIAGRILKEVNARLKFLVDVGLDYLTINRAAASLAGGEAQRIRLATQIGSGLTGVLYILDEPSIGLHQRDNRRLLETLIGLRDLGNTLIVVEHDEATIRAADYLVDIGPGAGESGGEIVAAGTLDEVLATPESITAQYLNGEKAIEMPAERRSAGKKRLKVTGAEEHNLKKIDVEFPLNVFTCVTGVSGSGKSTLMHDILHAGLMRRLQRSKTPPGKHRAIEGYELIDKVINIDQAPIGRTPRSNPATYIGLFDNIRKTFAETLEARARGYKPGRFSFNVKGGRCEFCAGDGTIKIEMHFLPDVYIPCDVCKGKRYNNETLEVTYKGKNIAEVLDMSVETGVEFFRNIPVIHRHLKVLNDVGLGYVKLGQPATTLSGGEAQRVKLASELIKRPTGKTLYILDEPTTGLHFDDINTLLLMLQKLVDAGNTVVIIEHNLDVIMCADWIIDLGPEGGDAGGELVVCGTPEDVMKYPASHTGRFLKQHLDERRRIG